MTTIIEEYKHEQKKINHIFHYTSKFPDLDGIIREGFIPSYCRESIKNDNYLIPMISFCNIPIAEVDKYMRYGKNGIGMSMEWAIKNGISPVTYFHEGSNTKLLLDGLNNAAKMDLRNPTTFGGHHIIDAIGIKLLQNLKFWKTEYKGEEINTYQEREWRFIPLLDDYNIIQEKYNMIIYTEYLDKKKKPKPHLPNHILKIDSIEDIKYIVVSTELQREKIIKTLGKKFSEANIYEALIKGRLSILTASQIRNDF